MTTITTLTMTPTQDGLVEDGSTGNAIQVKYKIYTSTAGENSTVDMGFEGSGPAADTALQSVYLEIH